MPECACGHCHLIGVRKSFLNTILSDSGQNLVTGHCVSWLVSLRVRNMLPDTMILGVGQVVMDKDRSNVVGLPMFIEGCKSLGYEDEEEARLSKVGDLSVQCIFVESDVVHAVLPKVTELFEYLLLRGGSRNLALEDSEDTGCHPLTGCGIMDDSPQRFSSNDSYVASFNRTN